MYVLHISGPPGAGKSTFVEHMTRGSDVAEFRWRQTPLYLLRYEPAGVWEVGQQATEEKPRRGSDRLTMNVIEYAWPWLVAWRPPFVLIEGARLEARSWRRACEALGYTYQVLYLDIDPVSQLKRLGARAQDDKWMQARRTQTRTFAKEATCTKFADGGVPVDRQLELWETFGCPIAQRFAMARTLNSGAVRAKPPSPEPAQESLL